MRSRLAYVVPVVLAMLASPTAHADSPPPPPPPPAIAPQTGVSALVAVPAVGHSGDVIYLSGTGLKPKTQYYILMACPAAFSGDAIQDGNFEFIQKEDGPETDAKGNFVRFTFHAMQLHKVKQSGCTIYTSDNVTPYGPNIPATYFIYSPHKKLPVCSLTICAGVSLSPRTARSGKFETIRIGPSQQKGYTSWPGAVATVSVKFQGARASGQVTKSVVLNWAGAGNVTVRVPTGMTLPSTGEVNVSYRIGKYTGHSVDNFDIIQ